MHFVNLSECYTPRMQHYTHVVYTHVCKCMGNAKFTCFWLSAQLFSHIAMCPDFGKLTKLASIVRNINLKLIN